jgi:membrane protein YqaA with SNARE-associated domain
MTEIGALWALFITAFASATILPLPSEGALIAFERAFPHQIPLAVLVATLGNTLGGLTTYLIGRFSGQFIQKKGQFAPQVLDALQRFGPASLLLSWLPIMGDILCGVAGWLKLSWWQCAVWMALGKGVRYALISML